MATGISTGKWKGDKIISYAEAVGGIDLSYQGKKPPGIILATPPASLVVKQVFNCSTGENRLIHGDNLAVMAGLLQDSAVCGKVQLCYIDPPYSTQSVFHSRNEKAAYMDLLKGPEYLEFLRERLILIRELLADSGSVYVHLDETMAFHAKIICDEIFGTKNFRNWITRKKCNTKNYTKHQFGDISDYILFYTKTDDYVWNRPCIGWTEETMLREYSYIDSNGRRFKKVPIHAPGERNGETGKLWKGMMPPKGKHWQYVPSKLDQLDEKGEIFWSKNGNPRRKIYFDTKTEGIPIQDIWMDFKDPHNQNIKITGYPTEKNFEMLKMIVEASSGKGDLVLDCFTGSSTTLEAAEETGRHWIGIDSSVEAIEVSTKRLLYGRERMGDYVKTKKAATQLDMELETKTPAQFQLITAGPATMEDTRVRV